MKTYIINLERSVKRRKHILAEAAKHKLEFELFPAVDGSALSRKEVEEMCHLNAIKKAPKWLTPGMLGCSLSHYKVYKKIIEDGINAAFVLEDDAILPHNSAELLADISANLETNEIVSLYYMSFGKCQLSKMDVTNLPQGFSLRFPIDISRILSTAGYVITRDAVKSLLDILLPIRVSPDSWGYFYENAGFKSFRCVYPMPIRITAVQSDIHSRTLRGAVTRFFDENQIPLLGKLVREMRQKSISELTKIELVDSPSTIAGTGLSLAHYSSGPGS